MLYRTVFILLLLWGSTSCFAEPELSNNPIQASPIQSTSPSVLKIYLDADRTRHLNSALSIEMGIKTAFAEIDNRVQDYNVEFVALDHRGNSAKSKLNMKKAFADPQALLVMAGMHSPPLIKHRAFINENNMLTLVPWAAGGPITRYPSSNNWVFRLSIDDTKAGKKIAEYAISTHGCKAPHLLLEQTPWGESNRKAMDKTISESLDRSPNITWYNWGISIESARIKLRAILAKHADCLLFVGNSNDGITFTKAIVSLDKHKTLPIFSHWGITGGSFHESITASIRKKIDLTFIQTCFSFLSPSQPAFSKRVFTQAQSLFPALTTEKDLFAPAGFIHAYDLSKILIEALSQFTLTDNMAQNRTHLKTALEDLHNPVQGLLKRYNRPFSVFSAEQDDAHEALTLDDFCMAVYGEDDEIIIIPKQ